MGRTEGQVSRLVLRGEVDLEIAEALLAEFLGVLEDERPGDSAPIEFDCSELTFIDSSGLNMLVRLSQQTDRRLILFDVPERCRTPFRITKLDEVFEIH